MRGYERHEFRPDMLKRAEEDDGGVSIDTLRAFAREAESLEITPSGYPNLSFAAATHSIIRQSREEAEAWVAENPPPAA